MNPKTAKRTPRADIPMPTEWSEFFNADHQAQVCQIIEFLNAGGYTRAWIGRLARVNSATLSVLLNGKYTADPTYQLNLLTSALDAFSNRTASPRVTYVPTSISKMVEVVCKRARDYHNFGILTGAVGVGKTAAVKDYCSRNPHTVLVEANPNMTPSVLLDELLEKLSAASGRSMDQRFNAICTALAGSTTLIVLDEAETVMPQCLHYLRRIRDKAEVGVVLVGTDRLQQIIKPLHGQFDQIRSRVGFWPQNIRAISREDADALAQAALNDQGELDDEVLEALWHYCRGSARMLIENFIPALRDYGLKKYPLTAELVEQVAEKVLFMGGMRRE